MIRHLLPAAVATTSSLWGLARFAHYLFVPPRRDELLEEAGRNWAAHLTRTVDGWKSQETGELTRILRGRHSCVYRWDHPARGTVALRAWPYSVPACRVLDHIEAGRLLRESGWRVPAVLAADDSWRTRGRFRIEAVVEEFARGECFDPGKPLNDAHLDRIAGDVGKLHARAASEWGKPWRFMMPLDPRAEWRKRLARISSKAARFGIGGLSEQEYRDLMARLRREIDKLDFGRPRLLHGNVTAGNIILDPNGELTWIDLQTVHYGHPQEEFSDIRRWLAPLGQYDAFMERYRAALADAGGEPSAPCPTLELVQALEKLVMRARRLTKRKVRASQERLEAEREWYEAEVRRLIARS